TSPVQKTAVARKGLVVTRDVGCVCVKRIKSSRRVSHRCPLRDPEMREICCVRAQQKKPAVADQFPVGADTVRDVRMCCSSPSLSLLGGQQAGVARVCVPRGNPRCPCAVLCRGGAFW
ncbi:hypothetical protein TraAM80_09687, partial [Trypanosoma rangeli]